MKCVCRALLALPILIALAAMPGRAERNLTRPPGTTRYALMLRQLNALRDFDRTDGANRMELTSLGQSVKGRQIWMVTLHDASEDRPLTPSSGGTGVPAPPELGAGGVKKVFYLCRQHGHEPSSTEGAMAFIRKLVRADKDSTMAEELRRVTVYVVPMANPDGAEAFLRHNAHSVDLNRDWLNRTQPETRAWYAALQRLRPDLMTDQHELYPNDRRPDFTETAGPGSGANLDLVARCDSTQEVVQGAMQAAGFYTVSHQINDHHPARLAHRYGCIVAGVPTILFETNRLSGTGRTLAQRAAAQEEFMTTVLRDMAGERPQLEAEAEQWRAAHVRDTMLASRHRPLPPRTAMPRAPMRVPVVTMPPAPDPEQAQSGKTDE